MNPVVLYASLLIISIANGIVITPNAVNEYVSVNLTPDSRGLNGIEDNEWKLYQRVGNTLNDWYIHYIYSTYFSILLLVSVHNEFTGV